MPVHRLTLLSGLPDTLASSESGAGDRRRGIRWRVASGAVSVVVVVLLGATVALWLGTSISRAQAGNGAADPNPGVTVPAPSKAGSLPGPGLVGATGPAETTGPTVPTGSAPPGTVARVTVHIVGAVKHPGIIVLPARSRVYQVIERAGGATPAAILSRINLAAVVDDGQQIVVPDGADPPAAAASASTGNAPATSERPPGQVSASTKVSLNTASLEEFETLPRVGPVLAQNIVEWRTSHGGFSTVDQLDAVDGIGPKLLALLLPLVTI